MPISDTVLAARLAVLVDAQLVVRERYQERPTRAGYQLTPRGRSLWPLLTAIWAWELRWVPAHAHPTPAMLHRDCGPMSPRFCCGTCGGAVRASDLATGWGPSGGWRRMVPDARTRRRRGEQAGLYPDTMAVFGNRWSSAVLGAAFLGVRRFTDFQERLGVPPTLLAQRLAALCGRGILRQDEAGAHYRLTEKGLDFFPVIATVVDWAERWYGSPAGPVLAWTHLDCGASLRGVLTCDRCGLTLRGADVLKIPLTGEFSEFPRKTDRSGSRGNSEN